MKARVQKVYDFIKNYITDYNYSPSVREIQNALKIKSTSTVQSDIKELIELGLIRRPNLKSRSLVLVEDNIQKEETVDIPIVGDVAAGNPILAIEDIEDYFPIPAHIAKSGEYFMLNIKGDSMIEAGIFDGDLILVKKTNYANHGDIIVALIDDSATVKRLYDKNGQVMLIPENSTMEPIIPDNLEILGKVISLFREHI